VCFATPGAESLADELKGMVFKEASSPVPGLIHLLQEQCSIVSRILNDVLSLQKMEEGRFVLELVPFSPEQLVQNAVESFKASFQSRRQTVSVKAQSLDAFVGLYAEACVNARAATSVDVQQGPGVYDELAVNDVVRAISPPMGAEAECKSKAMLIGGMLNVPVSGLHHHVFSTCTLCDGRLLPFASSTEQLFVQR